MKPVSIAVAGRELELERTGAPLEIEQLVPGEGPWEIEIGFGKGRYLLERALAEPERRFVGVEVAARYYGILRDRARRRRMGNLLLVRGEAAMLLATVLPRAFASALHVYFPDPWPKSRHHRRRLFDPANVDLLLGLLRPGATVEVATDHPDYGPVIEDTLRTHPSLEVDQRSGPWAGGARTNYEAKYIAEGRPILRLDGRLVGAPRLHPAAVPELLAGWGTLPER